MLNYLLPPIIGGFIGYITNELAIKMLFRPRKALYIGKFHVPFTPGLIPKQKDRIAASIGRVVSSQLLNSDTLRESLLSDNLLKHLYQYLQNYFKSFSTDTRTVYELLSGFTGPAQLDEKAAALRAEITDSVCRRIEEADLAKSLVENGMDTIAEKLVAEYPIVQMFMNANTIKNLFLPSIENAVRTMISTKAPELIGAEVSNLNDQIFEMRLCDLYNNHPDKFEQLCDLILVLYQNLLEENMDQILQTVNIEQIVMQKVQSFDALQLENIIFEIMRKELRAIVYLGALLGFLLGLLGIFC